MFTRGFYRLGVSSVSAAFLFTIWITPVITVMTARSTLADQGDCGQPVSTGTDPQVVDCLFILRVAIGEETCGSDPCICDTSASGATTATDALICLWVAVGHIVQPTCSCTGTTVMTATTTSTILEPGACGGAVAPACNGTCLSANQVCVADTFGGCICRNLGCGALVTGGRCDGLCPSGSACVFGVEGCRCSANVGPCDSATAPTCNGTCPSGSYCRVDPVDATGCECYAVGCGDLVGAPTCLGTCPIGSVCDEQDSMCTCVPGL